MYVNNYMDNRGMGGQQNGVLSFCQNIAQFVSMQCNQGSNSSNAPLHGKAASAEVAALRSRDDGETSDPKSAGRLLTYLRSLRAMMAVGVPPLPGTRVQRVAVDDVSAVWLTPNARSWNSSRAPRRVLLWFHGGAFVLCNTATHARLMSSMGVAGDARVLSVEYPLAPDQGVYEDMADAADRAYAWLVSERGGNVDPRDVVIGGDSAGGHLALALAQRLASSGADGATPKKQTPAGLVLLSPWLDPGRDLPSTAAAWRESSRSWLGSGSGLGIGLGPGLGLG